MPKLTIQLSHAALTSLSLGARNANALPVVLTTICAYALRRLEVVNMFAYRTSKPSLLKQAAEPIGRDNNRFILESVKRCDRIILAWGNHGVWRKQDLYILQLLENYDYLYSLGITKQGCPRHHRRAEWLRASLTRLAALQPALRSTTEPFLYDK